MDAPTRTDIWVCTDCYFAHHYGAHQHDGEWFAGESDTPCNREPLGELPDIELTDNTCSNHDGTDDAACTYCEQDGYENGIQEFSWSWCDGCGSTLGGARHRLAGWQRDTLS